MRLAGSDAKAQPAPSRHTGGRPDLSINAATRELGIDRTEAQRAVKVAGFSTARQHAAHRRGRPGAALWGHYPSLG